MRAKSSTRAFKKLKSLGADRMNEVDARLLSGEPCSSIAAWIQVDLGKCKDIKPASLKKMLERYRETELRQKTLARIANAQRGDSIKTIQKRLNALDEMEDMVRVQRGRVEKILMREANLPEGMLLRDASNELRLLKDMLLDLGKIQLETGLLAKAPKTFRGSMVSSDGQVKHFEWTEEQEELFRMIEKIENHAAEDA
jgi:hypothetical protein